MTSSAGTVADSSPMKAQSVSRAAALMPQSNPLESVNGSKLPVSMKNSPTTPITSSGTNLRIVVTTWIAPASRTPRMFARVRIQTSEIATTTAIQFFEASPQKTVR